MSTLALGLGPSPDYLIGKYFGPKLFNRPSSRLFKRENLDNAHEFMDKHGPKAIVLARFVPIIRTFAPMVAGAGSMTYRTFLACNVIGGTGWGAGVTIVGYWLGQITFIKEHVESILVGILLVSVAPVVIEVVRARRAPRATTRIPAQESAGTGAARRGRHARR